MNNVRTKRNIKLDILRGHYLVAILVDHFSHYVGPSLFIFYNGNGDLWASAAEGFVFLAGFFVSYVYYPKILIGKVKDIVKILWKRAFIVYLWSIFLTLAYSTAGVVIGDSPSVGNGIIYKNIHEMFINAALLNYSYGWADLLSLYVPLLFVSPVILYLFKKNLSWVVLGASFYLWALNLYHIECVRFCISFFDLYSWQFLFILGMYVAYKREYFKALYTKVKNNPTYLIVLVLLFSTSLILSILDVFGGYFQGQQKTFINLIFNKETLSIGRVLVFFIWIAFAYFVVERFSRVITRFLGWIYLPFGQNSLLTYIIQSVVLFVAYYINFSVSYWNNTVSTFVVLICVWILVKLSMKIRFFLQKPLD